MIETLLSKLEQRLGGRLYAKQRLGIETDHEAQDLWPGTDFLPYRELVFDSFSHPYTVQADGIVLARTSKCRARPGQAQRRLLQEAAASV